MKWKPLLGNIGARFLGAVLLVAAVAKAYDPGVFAEQIQQEGLDFLFSAGTVVLIALALETALGAALLMGLRQTWVLNPTALMVAFFLSLNGRNYWLFLNGLLDENAGCGCFGTLLNRTPAEAFWQDLFLLVPPLLLAFWGSRPMVHRLPKLALTVTAVSTIAVVVYAGANPDLYFVEAANEIAERHHDRGFVPTSDYRLIINQTEATESEIYHSEELVAFLIFSPQLSDPVLLRPRTGTVERVAQNMISRTADGSITLPPETAFRPEGEFEITAKGISFTVGEYELLLKSN